MKKYIVLLLLVAISSTAFAQAPAHKKHKSKKRVEKVVVNSDQKKTVVEVKDDKIYVNGDVVSTISAQHEDHKIVINHTHAPHAKSDVRHTEHKKAADETVLATPPPDNSDKAGESPTHNAILGVYANKASLVSGAYVATVMPGSPAQMAGLRPKDVVIKVDQTAVNSSDELIATIGMYKPGDQVLITYLRDGNEQHVNVVLGDRQEIEEKQMSAQMPDLNWQKEDNSRQKNDNNGQNFNGRNDNNWQNNDFGSNDNRFRDEDNERNGRYPKPVQIGVDATDGRHPRGIFLENVKPGSPAEAAGLQKGDIITRINGERVREAVQMQFLLSLPDIGNTIWIDYRHNGERMNTEVHLRSENNERPRFRRRNYQDAQNW